MMAFAVDEAINSRGDRGDFVYYEIKYLLETDEPPRWAEICEQKAYYH